MANTDVGQIFTDQRAAATAAVGAANIFVNELKGIVEVEPELFTAEIDPVASQDVVSTAESTLLNLRPITFIIPSIGGPLPTVVDPSLPGVPDVVVPEFTQTAPTLNFPQPPDPSLPSVPIAPSIAAVALPDRPDILFPDAPVIVGINLPAIPDLDLPFFTTSVPINDLITPTNTFEFAEEPYISDNLTALSNKIFNDLVDGGYGIDVTDESAMLERIREREKEIAQADIDNIFVETAARGFPLPPGDLNVAIQAANQRYLDKVSTANREIFIKRADMFVENRKFTIEQVRQVEQMLLNYHNLVMERLLNVQKAFVEMGIAVFNARVANYNAKLEAYRAEAQVFAERIRAALAKVEVYRTTMEGKKIESDIQRNQVELYRTQLTAVNTIVEVFKTEMEAANIQTNIERVRIESFRSLIDAFTSQVQAKVAQFGMFTAQIQGETAKVQAFAAEAQAYDAIVQGKKVASDINISRAKLTIEQSAQRVAIFQARIAAYEASLRAQTAQVDALLKKYSGDVSLYQATSQALAEAFRLKSVGVQNLISAFTANANVAVENAKIKTQGTINTLNSRVAAGSAGAEYYKAYVGGLAGSLMALAQFATSQ